MRRRRYRTAPHPPSGERRLSPEPGAADGLRIRRLRAGGHILHVRGTFSAQGPPIVLVHGIGMSGEYFLPYAEALAATHDVYALDLPGYGKTPKPDRALTVPELGEVVAEAIASLGLDSPVVVGHSMGCQIVAQTVSRHSELCAGYILIGPTVDPAARSLPAQAWRLLRDSMREPLLSNAVIFRNYLRMGPLRYLRTSQYMLADRLDETIQTCAVPGLIIRGARDPIASHDWVRQLSRLAPDARALEVPDGPHALQHNRPQELLAACRPFLRAAGGR
ncbi:alpha/beta fold hydrolase [Nesterenkonia alkaliphila]|uniref:Alpha/beta fold hydrolase n=1 Tax=Nesterenkonia alkaliphila TaxID=1463631 RepID=A0A7K1UI35_9MICC|nr:alpha/beta hydrolase [Nesterenkonia alkaliphila]MVT25761.1 alpha/beta fold hydrolase [Nesterenkonia alkaliphila]